MRSLISRARRRSRSPCSSAWGDDADVACLRTLRPVLHLVLHLRAFSEALEALAADRAVVDEDILATVILLDKAVTLVVVEPLHGSGCHICTFSTASRTCSGRRKAKTGTRSNSWSRKIVPWLRVRIAPFTWSPI